MTQEQKDLLLKDLCGRLPYGVKCSFDNKVFSIDYISAIYDEIKLDSCDDYTLIISDVKPYLLPLSSMTEEQCYDFYCRFVENEIDYDDFKKYYFDDGLWHKLLTSIDDCERVVDWFHKNHFDYRGLIPMGLANDVTGLNIY